jgi:hypothetical protein
LALELQQVLIQQQLELLRREIRRLQLEQDILKKANELLKKPLLKSEWVDSGFLSLLG